jgi:Mn-dependent DtxR family transcriptional regulator
MKWIEQLESLDRLDHLIRRKGTGNYERLAHRLDVSHRTVYNLLEILKSLGAELKYCKLKQTYYYANEVNFEFSRLLRLYYSNASIPKAKSA